MAPTRWVAVLLGTAWKSAGLLLVLSGLAATAQAGATPPGVPEIDAGSVLSAMTLLGGGLMVLTDRRARRAR